MQTTFHFLYSHSFCLHKYTRLNKQNTATQLRSTLIAMAKMCNISFFEQKFALVSLMHVQFNNLSFLICIVLSKLKWTTRFNWKHKTNRKSRTIFKGEFYSFSQIQVILYLNLTFFSNWNSFNFEIVLRNSASNIKGIVENLTGSFDSNLMGSCIKSALLKFSIIGLSLS